MDSPYGRECRKVYIDERIKHLINGMFATSNLGLAWKLNENIDLSASYEKNNQIAQEQLRGVASNETMIYDPMPTSVWTNFAYQRNNCSKTPKENRLWRYSDINKNNKLLELIQKYDLVFSEDDREAIKSLYLNSTSAFGFKYASRPADIVHLMKNFILMTLYRGTA
jgi:hypothetical protein